ncbi:hypothetical protein P3L10_025510 [Capsicum annuum]
MAHASVKNFVLFVKELVPWKYFSRTLRENVFGEMTDFVVEVKEVASAVEYTIQLRLTDTVLGENKCIIGIIGSRFFKGISNIWTRQKFRKSLQQSSDYKLLW